MKIIDADVSIEKIKSLPIELDAETIQRCIEVLSNMPSAQPEREKGKWIPCSEQLPEDSNFYIVTRKDFLVGFIWYSVFHGWEWDEQNNIIAWMPLPEEYRGEQDEQSKTQICCTNCN